MVAHVDDEIRGVGIASEIPFGPYAGQIAYLTTYGSYEDESDDYPGHTIYFYFFGDQIDVPFYYRRLGEMFGGLQSPTIPYMVGAYQYQGRCRSCLFYTAHRPRHARRIPMT